MSHAASVSSCRIAQITSKVHAKYTWSTCVCGLFSFVFFSRRLPTWFVFVNVFWFLLNVRRLLVYGLVGNVVRQYKLTRVVVSRFEASALDALHVFLTRPTRDATTQFSREPPRYNVYGRRTTDNPPQSEVNDEWTALSIQLILTAPPLRQCLAMAKIACVTLIECPRSAMVVHWRAPSSCEQRARLSFFCVYYEPQYRMLPTIEFCDFRPAGVRSRSGWLN